MCLLVNNKSDIVSNEVIDMEIKKTDRRIRKTEKQLREGLLELLKKKKIQDITVQELVDEVDINRSTFYLHYKDIYDLLEQIEQDYFADFNDFIESHKFKKGSGLISNGKIVDTFIDYFEFLKDHKDLITVLIGYNGDPTFSRHQLKKLTQTISNWIYVDIGISKSQKSEDVFEYCMYGSIGLVRKWVINGYEESPESIGKLAGSIIVSTVQQFLLNPNYINKN